MLLALAAVTIFSGPTLTWTDRDVRVGGYSLRQAAIKAVEADEREREKDNAEALSRKDPEQETLRRQIKEHGKPYCSLQQRWSVLSAVGPVVSYRQDQDEFCLPAAHPWGGATYHALDARKPGRKASLLDFFPDQEVLKALLADRLVAKALAGFRPRTSLALVEKLKLTSEGCDYGFDPDMLSAFAFHHLEGNRVAVRIGLSHGCEAARGSLTQLGILLPIPASLKAPLQAAAALQGGFLMQDAEAISKGRAASLVWGKPF